jgi:iron complex transport system substrate-binding protein
MKKITTFLVLTLIMMVSLAACGSASNEVLSDATTVNPSEENVADTASVEEVVQEEITIVHELGETVLNTNPEKVVVFDYGFLDILDYVGLGDKIVGVPQSSNVPDYLDQYNGSTYANVGSLKEADFEKVYELKPDVIFISGRMSANYDELAKIAPTVYLPMPGATYLTTVEENLNTFATIFTTSSDKFTDEIDSIVSRVEAIRATVESNGYTGLMTQTNDANVTVFGFGSRYAMLYEDLGFTITDETIEESSHGQSGSFEYIAKQNPDYLFVVDRSAAVGTDGATGAKALLDNELINGMDAAKNNRIAYLNSTIWYTVSGGINSTSMMLEEIENALKN